jgi:prepilin-type N-terminal cleavage/methylation domain-containing protein
MKRRKTDGFTLIEAMIAITILVLGLGGAALTFNMAVRSEASNEARAEAMHFARDQMEFLRVLAWNDPALAPGSHTITNTTAYGGTYDIAAAGTDLRDITVNVTWVNDMALGAVGPFSLTTTFTKALH